MSDLLLLSVIVISVFGLYKLGNKNGYKKGLENGYGIYRKVGKMMFEKFEREGHKKEWGMGEG